MNKYIIAWKSLEYHQYYRPLLHTSFTINEHAPSLNNSSTAEKTTADFPAAAIDIAATTSSGVPLPNVIEVEFSKSEDVAALRLVLEATTGDGSCDCWRNT